MIADPRIIELMARVEMLTVPAWDDRSLRSTAPEGARVRIELHRGGAVEGFCPVPRGAASRPLSAAEIDAKFRDCASLAGDAERAADLLRWLRTVEGLASARDLLRAPERAPAP